MQKEESESSAMQKKEGAPRVHWDEVTIQEHNQERGTRQTIDEAPTPYNYLSDEEEDDNTEEAEGKKEKTKNSEEVTANLEVDSVLTFPVQQRMESADSVDSHRDSGNGLDKTKEEDCNNTDGGIGANSNAGIRQEEVYQQNSSNSVSMHLLQSKLLLQETRSFPSKGSDKNEVDVDCINGKKDDDNDARHDDQHVDTITTTSSFKKKRASHYNEFLAMKALKQLSDSEDDET